MSALREPLTEAQDELINVIYEPFQLSGRWPIWQFVDLTLDSMGLDASEVLTSLPRVRNANPGMWSSTYSLTSHMNMSSSAVPLPDQQISLTVAGLWHIGGAAPLLETFLATLKYLNEQQRNLRPMPYDVVNVEVTSEDIAAHLLTSSIAGQSAPPVEATMLKLHQILSLEPILHVGVQRPNLDMPHWIVRPSAALRELRAVTTIEEYLDRIIRWVAPPAPPQLPSSLEALDIPYSVDYLDAVWKSKTGIRLFSNLNPTSVARVTQSCASENDFNSLLSAVADILSRVVAPGRQSPPQRGALEALSEGIDSMFETEALERVREAINVLILVRHLRSGDQHGDARHRTVEAFAALGLPFPPANWGVAWMQIAVLTKRALDAIREEVAIGVSEASNG